MVSLSCDRLTPHSAQLDEYYSIWEFFQKHHWVAPSINHTPIIDAWERCRHQCNPFTWTRPHVASGATFKSLFRRNSNLIAISRTVLEDTLSLMPNKRCCMIVADETGCTLLIMGHPNLCQKLHDLGVKEGAFWSEGRIGSNALNQSLHLSDPVSMHGAQHFKRTLHTVSSHAAPVFSLEGGQRGVIALFTAVEDYQEQDCALVNSCARETSNMLKLESTLSESNYILSQRDALLAGIDEGVIAWDSYNRISYINEQAKHLLNIDKQQIVGKSLKSILLFPPLVQTAINEAQPLVRVDVTFECEGDFIEATVSLQPIADKSYLLFVHPPELNRARSQHQAGSNVRLSFDSFVAQSPQMKQLITIAKRACKSNSSLLLLGENGTGKRHLAMAIHNHGLRSHGPFISVNCAGFEADQMMTELFGSEDGQDHPGKVEQANGGTLYLEHIESLTPPAQAQLLHMLKNNTIYRYQSKSMMIVRLNLICSSQLDVDTLLQQIYFSRQLYYGISPVELRMPPLRERQDDLVVLLDKQLDRLNRRYHANLSLSGKAREYLYKYTWPGNVTELQNCMENIVLQRRSDRLGVKDLQSQLLSPTSTQLSAVPGQIKSLDVIEKQAIQHVWTLYNGKAKEVAEALGIGRTTLWRKLKKYQIIRDE